MIILKRWRGESNTCVKEHEYSMQAFCAVMYRWKSSQLVLDYASEAFRFAARIVERGALPQFHLPSSLSLPQDPELGRPSRLPNNHLHACGIACTVIENNASNEELSQVTPNAIACKMTCRYACSPPSPNESSPCISLFLLSLSDAQHQPSLRCYADHPPS